ncbi:SGNH/GDSL hydrolase family protein [Bacillus horti]|uniref:Lysophospholipase L1-like esterase n=1 Tax=Caldalkalibacillus horti TaxID=77523 RepID=A0ABT9W4Z1_9BACI|nr:SGNH/GDSL hydrolase family protein [Bacillus horti]MDQ0168301.1 lysophospholipase L1-like esterase [Bacillus horti]
MQKHLVAMGDSLTEGIGDEVKDVQLKSWVAHFAEFHQPALKVTNLAKRGLLSHQIRSTQLEETLSHNPDIVSLIAGGNDVLKDGWNPEQYQVDMEFMVQQLTQQRPDVAIMTSTLPDFTLRLPLPSEKKKIMKEQLLEANEIIRSIGERHDLLLIDFWNHPLSQEPTVWSQDLVHPNSVGYQEIGKIVYKEYAQWQEKK